jgi:hypothetical protein
MTAVCLTQVILQHDVSTRQSYCSMTYGSRTSVILHVCWKPLAHAGVNDVALGCCGSRYSGEACLQVLSINAPCHAELQGQVMLYSQVGSKLNAVSFPRIYFATSFLICIVHDTVLLFWLFELLSSSEPLISPSQDEGESTHLPFHRLCFRFCVAFAAKRLLLQICYN